MRVQCTDNLNSQNCSNAYVDHTLVLLLKCKRTIFSKFLEFLSDTTHNITNE